MRSPARPAGLNVLLVDRKNTLDQKIHTTGIFVRRTLVDFDIPDDCLGPPIRTVSLYSPALRSSELVSEHDEFRIGRMGQLYQRYLQQCLLSRRRVAAGNKLSGIFI